MSTTTVNPDDDDQPDDVEPTPRQLAGQIRGDVESADPDDPRALAKLITERAYPWSR